MKTYCCILSTLALLCCSHPEKSQDSFPPYEFAAEDLISYEGILPSSDGSPVPAKLELKPGAPGLDSDYKFHESMYLVNVAAGQSSRGKYTVLLAAASQRIIHVINCKLVAPPRGKWWLLREQPTCDLYFRTTDGNELVLVDDKFEQVQPHYTLIRRSDLFTAEGYVTVYDDSTADFFERNTRKEWPLAKYGYYSDVIRKYHSSPREKFEGIYLKALSYTVSCRRDNGELFDAVVFKRVLDMDTAAATH